jgi:restriction system protein
MWNGNLNTGVPSGWLEGTGLTVKDYWGERGEGGPHRLFADAVRQVANEKGWSEYDAKTVIAAYVQQTQARVFITFNTPRPTKGEVLAYVRGITVKREIESLPSVLLGVELLEGYQDVEDGQLIRVVEAPWSAILEIIKRDPESIYQFSWRKWEEIIAASYKAAGFESVILTDRSADRGRDVIAEKKGFCALRVYDQVKAYSPGHLVTADDVAALVGRVMGRTNVTKGIITTTARFAPRIMDDPAIALNAPYRIELRDREILLPFLGSLQGKKPTP